MERHNIYKLPFPGGKIEIVMLMKTNWNWIKDFLYRIPYSCAEDSYVNFRIDRLRENVYSRIEDLNYDIEKIHQGCLECLKDDDIKLLNSAISCLFVIGNKSDIGEVEKLLEHPNEKIKKAAKTCIFELNAK